eukprot:12260585-Alexandrium_andersonii.AAC.1
MLRPFLGPRSSRLECLRRFQRFQLALVLLGSIGSIRYSVRSIRGVRVTEYVLDLGSGLIQFQLVQFIRGARLFFPEGPVSSQWVPIPPVRAMEH